MATNPRTEELRRWRHEASAELQHAQDELRAAQRRIDATRERVSLLDRLLAVEEGNGVGANPAAPPDADALLNACEELVKGAGKPLHVKELIDGLVQRGVPLPGRGNEANLITRLHRSDGRFVRTGRGTYAPASFGLPEVRPTRKRRVSGPAPS